MCGVAGLFNFDGSPVDRRDVERMLAPIAHRGPDEDGVWTNGSIGFGHRRLSIIDLASGQQPMRTADGSLTVTFNGEIFNYVELRESLQSKGYVFQTQSDTEVILHLYAEYGEDCVQHMNGQWAFAIWDAHQRKLFLSRDRLGIRPLYYTKTARTFLFASEVKALFAVPEVDRDIDLVGLDQVFTFWAPLAPRTIFRNIQELPPGHSLSVQNGRFRSWQYWNLNYEEFSDARTAEDYAEELRHLLIDATRLRLRSDVPVGAYLSGGLDSSVTTALIKRFTDAPLSTFSVAFEDTEFDESRFQDSVVRHLNTAHQQIRCTYQDIGRVFPDVIWHTERPVLRTAPAPLFLLSQLVRDRGYKVVMTGEGADEVLGGYDIFKEAKVRRFWAQQPDSKLRSSLIKRLYPYMTNLQAQPLAYLKAFFGVRPEALSNPFFSHLPRWELTAKLKSFLAADVRQDLSNYSALDELLGQLPDAYSHWKPFCQSQFLETSGLLPGYILSSQGDRMAMAHSVEGRFPFLDYRVVEFGARIPSRLKMNGLNEKYLLKRATEDLLPEEVVKRPKQPYRAPDVPSFIAQDGAPERFDYVGELLSPERLNDDGLFDSKAVGRLVDKAKSGRAIGTRDNMALVGVLSTQLLLDQFVRNPGHRSSRSVSESMAITV